jgi:hypothetical protein
MQKLYVKLPLLGRGHIMPLSIKALVPLGRATILASAVIVASGILEITGCPLFAAVGKVTLNWAAVRSETEKLRQKITTAAYRARIRSAVAVGVIPHEIIAPHPIASGAYRECGESTPPHRL